MLLCLLHNNFSESTNFNIFLYKFNCTNHFNIFINDILSSSFINFYEFHQNLLEYDFISIIFIENVCLNLRIKSLSNLLSKAFIENGFSNIRICLLLFSVSRLIQIFRNKMEFVNHVRSFCCIFSNSIQRRIKRPSKIYFRLKKKLLGHKDYKDILIKICLISVFAILTFSSKIVLMNSNYSSISFLTMTLRIKWQGH